MSDYDPQAIAGPVISKVFDNLQKIFSKDVLNSVFPDVPVPMVSLDLPGSEPEPLHVFVWGTARDFDTEQFVTGAHMEISFHVWVTVIATSSTSEDASRIANKYQSMVMQMSLCSPTLGNIASDAFSPKIKEAESWADVDGRRHAGYLIDLGYSVIVSASPFVAQALAKE